MDEVNFSFDDYADITDRDTRYDGRAYAFLRCAMERASDGWKRHISGAEVLEEFKELALDQYGPLAYRVLTEWGLACTEDIGEMMTNLCESGRIKADENDSKADFSNGYDFEEEFLGPFKV